MGPPPSVRSFVTSRRSCAMSPSTTRLRCRLLHPVHHSRNPMSCPMDRSSPSEESDSAAQRSCSSPPSSEWSPLESTRAPTTATSISERTCTPTPSCPEEPPCSQVSLTACRRRSPPHQRGNTPAGSEDPSWLPSPPSQACGSQRPSTRSLAQPSSTANASKRTAAEKHRVRSYGRRKGVEKTFVKTLYTLSLKSCISKDRCGSEELGENTDRFGTTHKDFPPTQSARRPEFASQVDFFDKKSIRDDL